MHNRSESQGRNAMQLTISLLLGGMLALGVEVLLLLLGAILVSKGVLKDDISAQITVVACVIGCLIGGSFTCGRWQTRRLLAGLAAGGMCFLLILAVGLLSGGLEPGGQGVIELAACLCGGGAAGLLGRKKKKRKHAVRRAK